MGKKDRPQGSSRNSSHYVRLSGLSQQANITVGRNWKRDWGQAGWKAEEGRIKALEEEGGQRLGGCNSLERERCIKQQGSLLSAHCGNGAFVLLLSCSRTSRSIRAADRS